MPERKAKAEYIPPPPPVPFRESPARSYAKASGFPWPWNPGLDRTWVRLEEPDVSDRGEYHVNTDLIKVNPVDQYHGNKNLLEFYEALNHELAHPTQDFLSADYEKYRWPESGSTYKPLPGLAPSGWVERLLGKKHPYQDYRYMDWRAREDGLPKTAQYEDPFAYWIGQYAIGNKVPDEVKKIIESSVYYDQKSRERLPKVRMAEARRKAIEAKSKTSLASELGNLTNSLKKKYPGLKVSIEKGTR